MTGGRYLVIAGPDGSGKTTVAGALEARLAQRGPVLRAHHGIRVLPRKTQHTGEPVPEPHAKPVYPAWLARVKVLWLFVDFLLGWLLVARPWCRRGGVVIVERGWWDALVDPRRYRLAGELGITRLLGRLLPAPDLTVVLEGPPDVLMRRKDELAAAEIERQAAAWRRVPTRRLHLDARRSPDDLVDEIDAALGRAIVPRRYARLPSRRDARWTVPSRPGRVARAGLAVYQPVTPLALVGWLAAREAARLGALRPLDGVAEPDELGRLRELVPAAAAIAIERRRADKAHGLLLDADGRPIAMVKFAAGGAARARLAAEAGHLGTHGSSLPSPLRAPAVIAAEDGVLVMEAIDWRPRIRPWRLDPDVAAALGRFYRSGAVPPGDRVGPSHGDMAPWNLLRTRDGWAVVDWADATAEGGPFDDVFSHLVQTHVLLGKPRLQELLAGVEGDGWVGTALDAYARGAELTDLERWPALVGYLDRSRDRPDPLAPTYRHELAMRDRLMVEARRRAQRESE